ncbi:MAG: DUF4159 domain-containing protein, partial [Gemmatimonas sp.]
MAPDPSIPDSDPLHRVSRRDFLVRLGTLSGALALGTGLPLRPLRAEGTRLYEFVFARLRYNSGDWDYNPKVCANMLDAVLQYTQIPVSQQEIVITADSAELTAFPFLFMTGHKLVRFSEKERQGLVRYVE